MGSDSAATDSEGRQLIRADPKVFRVGAFLIGFCGSFRMGQLLRFKLTPPPHRRTIATDRYLGTLFLDTVRQTLAEGGYARKQNNVETGGNFLVGYRGRLFEIEGDFQVGESAYPYSAIGSGADVALGAMFNRSGEPKVRIYNALKAAAAFSAGVRAPYKIEVIG